VGVSATNGFFQFTNREIGVFWIVSSSSSSSLFGTNINKAKWHQIIHQKDKSCINIAAKSINFSDMKTHAPIYNPSFFFPLSVFFSMIFGYPRVLLLVLCRSQLAIVPENICFLDNISGGFWFCISILLLPHF